ncbi:cytosolic sulfotransferase 5-like [Prosopis cineraria]|uniref:cytosolic sulfotransferase 5-like n=1 Tax=Prosopis cineraria TaxID=364024 RepID=UPI00240EAFF1|nr:cytosolic sulfotransferase 5-like [Prosopis cineraria]
MAAENSPKTSDVTLFPNFHQQDDDQYLSQKTQDLIATLPTESDSFAAELCQYQGFWFPKRLMQGILNCQNHFQAHDSDIFLVTSPRSGTTWLKALIFAIINRKTYHPNMTQTGHTHPLLTTNPHVLIPFLEFHLYLRTNNPDLSLFPSPRVFATHLPIISMPDSTKKHSGCKIVYLCRDPKDMFVSLWHFINGFKKEKQGFNSIGESFEDFCRGMSIYGPFWEHMLGYYKESLKTPEKVIFLRFEELKNEPVKTLKKLADFIGYGFSKEEENENVVSDMLKLCSFENLSNLEVNKNGNSSSGIENELYFRRGKVEDWKNFLSLDLAEQLDNITQKKLEKHGLKF